MVEQLTLNQRVVGSSPTRFTSFFQFLFSIAGKTAPRIQDDFSAVRQNRLSNFLRRAGVDSKVWLRLAIDPSRDD